MQRVDMKVWGVVFFSNKLNSSGVETRHILDFTFCELAGRQVKLFSTCSIVL